MTYLKINKDRLQSTVDIIRTACGTLESAKSKATSFKIDAYNHSDGWDKKIEPLLKANKDLTETEAYNLAEMYQSRYRSAYYNVTSAIFDSCSTLKKIKTAFEDINTSIIEYDDTNPGSLEENFINSFNSFGADGSGMTYEESGLSFSQQEDENGNIRNSITLEIDGVTASIAEATGAAVINCGMKLGIGAVLANNLVNDSEFRSLDAEEQRSIFDSLLKDVNKNSDEQTTEYLKRGTFAMTSLDEIKDRYESVTGVEYDEERVAEEAEYFKERVGTDTLYEQGLYGLEDIGGFVAMAGVFNFAKDKGAVTDEELEKDGKGYLAKGRRNVIEGKVLTDEGKIDESVLINPGVNDDEDTGQTPEIKLTDGGSGTKPQVVKLGDTKGTGTTIIKENPNENTPGAGTETELNDGIDLPRTKSFLDEREQIVTGELGENGPTIDEMDLGYKTTGNMVKITDDSIPNTLEKVLTNEEIDSLAEDAFYNQFSPEELANYRSEQTAEFESMFNNEDKTDLIEFFNENGYTLNDAQTIANNEDLSLVAFMAAKQSADMADMSRKIAESANFDMTKFDTKFDDAPSFNDLTSGDANAFISNPSQDVLTAKQNMSDAKTRYDLAVGNANNSINEANENKEQLGNIRRNIIKRSGTDSSKWSDEDVEEYNDAVNRYNQSVKKANDDVDAAQNAKNVYESSKDIYENKKDEFYESIKEDMMNSDGSSQNTDVGDAPVGASNEPQEFSALDAGFTENGNVETGSVADSNEFVGVDESGTGLGIRDVNDVTLEEFGGEANMVTPEANVIDGSEVVVKENAFGFNDNGFNNENNSEYIYHEDNSGYIDPQLSMQQMVDPSIIQEIYNTETENNRKNES